MTRNTVRRVEVAAPLYNARIKQRVWNMFETLLNDNVKARNQLPDGTYIRAISEHPPLDAQRFFFEEAYRKAEKRLPTRRQRRLKGFQKTNNLSLKTGMGIYPF